MIILKWAEDVTWRGSDGEVEGTTLGYTDRYKPGSYEGSVVVLSGWIFMETLR